MKKYLLLLLCVSLIGIGQTTLLVPSQYSTIQNAINAQRGDFPYENYRQTKIFNEIEII
jgi:hypothetical protein